jgi:site-specific DNA-methyltransferase (adenine-specific)
MKALYYGDNLQVLRESVASESVDLVHLDRPFNSSRRAEHE